MNLAAMLWQLSVLSVFQTILTDRAARRDAKLKDLHAFAQNFVRRFFEVTTPRSSKSCRPAPSCVPGPARKLSRLTPLTAVSDDDMRRRSCRRSRLCRRFLLPLRRDVWQPPICCLWRCFSGLNAPRRWPSLRISTLIRAKIWLRCAPGARWYGPCRVRKVAFALDSLPYAIPPVHPACR